MVDSVQDQIDSIDENFDDLTAPVKPGYGGVSPFRRQAKALPADLDAGALVPQGMQLSPEREAMKQKLLEMIGRKTLQQKAAQVQATQTPQYKSKQLIGMLALAAIPTLIGAMKGRRGLEVGGAIGSQVSAGYWQLKRDEQEKERLRAELQAQQLAEEKSALDHMLLDPYEKALETSEANAAEIAKRQEMADKNILFAPPASTNVYNTVEDKSLETFEKSQAAEAGERLNEDSANTDKVLNASADIVSIIDEGIRKGAWKEDENYVQAVIRDFVAGVNPNTEGGDLKRALTNKLLEKLQLIKGNANEKELWYAQYASATSGPITTSTLREHVIHEVNRMISDTNFAWKSATSRKGSKVIDDRQYVPYGIQHGTPDPDLVSDKKINDILSRYGGDAAKAEPEIQQYLNTLPKRSVIVYLDTLTQQPVAFDRLALPHPVAVEE